MLSIHLKGARDLLDLLLSIKEGRPPSGTELEEVMAANAFFTGFYSQWEGSDRVPAVVQRGCPESRWLPL